MLKPKQMLIFLLLILPVYSAEPQFSISGFENVVLYEHQDTLFVRYDNTVFRQPRAALFALAGSLPADQPVVLMPSENGLPLGAYVIEDVSRLQAGELSSVSGFDPHRRLPIEATRPSIRPGRTDLIVAPGLALQLGHYDDRVKLYVDLRPRLKTALWRGSVVEARAAIPLVNEIYYYEDNLRPLELFWEQRFRLPGVVQGRFRSGLLGQNRWGYCFELARALYENRLLVGWHFARSGYAALRDGVWNYSHWNRNSWRLYADGFWPRLGLVTGISYNHYLAGDQGWRAHMTRYYGDTGIGVFFSRTEQASFGGVQFHVPLGRVKPARRWFRVALPGYYHWQYQANNQVYTYGPPLQSGLALFPFDRLQIHYRYYIKGAVGFYDQKYEFGDERNFDADYLFF